jgi:hypothetical protein
MCESCHVNTVASIQTSLLSVICPGDATRFLRLLNEANERIHRSGQWLGVREELSLDIALDERDNTVVYLPNRYASIVAALVDDRPVPVVGFMSRFNESGNGEPTEGSCRGVILDDGTTPYRVAYPGTGRLRVSSSDAGDNGDILYVHGYDSNKRIVHTAAGVDGEPITLNSATPAFTTNSFSRVTGLIRSTGEGRVTVAWEDPDTLALTTIAELEPGQPASAYRRYRVLIPGCETLQVVALRRPVPLVQSTDVVNPSNLGALKMAMTALIYEENNDLERSEQFWAKCYSLLDEELKFNRGGALGTLRVQIHGLKQRKVSNHY